jgi:nitrite reductase/ring-hydroxylating ferredoxin subunit
MISLFLLSLSLLSVNAYNPIFNHWHCLGFTNTIEVNKPFTANVGELPLIIWRTPDNRLQSAINMCPHMGSKLDNGKVTEDGCLQCQYHGLHLREGVHTFGEVVEFQNKILWSYKPIQKKPFPVPFYNNPKFVKSHIVVDMDAALTDCAFNTMDIRHPEFVHSGLFGFGNKKPPANIKHYVYSNGVGLEFDYSSNSFIEKINRAKTTHNFHIFNYPSFTWSKVSFNGNNLIIGVDLLPVGPSKTRWFVTICHDYFTDAKGMLTMKVLASKVLFDDWKQMGNQGLDSPLKKEILFNDTFENEEALLILHDRFKHYKYPNILDAAELFKHHKKEVGRGEFS